MEVSAGMKYIPELRRAGIDALVRALGPVGMARFLNPQSLQMLVV
jgi:hypothetical protein